MNDGKLKINRTAIGLTSLACLAVAGFIRYQDYSDGTTDWPGWLVRLGVTIGAIWIASAKWFGAGGSIALSPKALLAVVAALTAISIRPRISIPALVVITALWFFVRPRNPKSTIDRSKNRK